MLLKCKRALEDECWVHQSWWEQWPTMSGLIWRRRKGLVFASPKVCVVLFLLPSLMWPHQRSWRCWKELEARQIQFHELKFRGVFLIPGRSNHTNKRRVFQMWDGITPKVNGEATGDLFSEHWESRKRKNLVFYLYVSQKSGVRNIYPLLKV